MAVRARRGKSAQCFAESDVAEEGADKCREPRVGDLAGEELEEAVELVRIAPQRGDERAGIRVGCGLERAHLQLQPSAEPFDPTEDANRVTLTEALVEQLDVVPHPRLDSAARIHELEREIGGAAARPAPLLLRHCEHAFDGPVLGELGDAGHAVESTTIHYARDMAVVSPFRAARYAQPSDRVVAPPYDVISPAERDTLAARDPHNVVSVTLADSEEDAGRLFRTWLAEGVLVRDAEPAVWALSQDYIGPDGVARRREGIVAALRVEPYETRIVLPHERTHEGPKESRLRLLRAARAQVEPIFLLYDGDPPVAPPGREPDLQAEGTRLWRVDAPVAEFFADRQLLIADGHHRYETALAYHAEEGTPESAHMLVVLVSTSDPGLEIFPTHRVFSGRPDLPPLVTDRHKEGVADALQTLAAEPYDRSTAIAYAGGRTALIHGEPGELDVELVDRFGHDGIAYTPDAGEAVRRVDEGEADVAFLLRATRIEDVFARARRGEVMPQKTTYFFPKLLSGLLFMPLEP